MAPGRSPPLDDRPLGREVAERLPTACSLRLSPPAFIGLVPHVAPRGCRAFSKVFDRRVAAWKFPHLTIHGLRHTWATLALEGGVHPRVVQERLGHSTIAVTLQTYSHVSPTLHDEAARGVAASILR